MGGLRWVSTDPSDGSLVKIAEAFAYHRLETLVKRLDIAPSRHSHKARVTGPCADVQTDSQVGRSPCHLCICALLDS